MPALVEVLAAQQPTSHYPLRWPLPFPPEEFVVRKDEERAWVAELDGSVIGHVAVSAVDDDELGQIWSAGAGRPIRELACMSVLFVDDRAKGTGAGGALIRTSVDWIRGSGRTPVLDVVQRHSTAASVYLHLGWRQVGTARPEWLPDHEPPILLMVLPD
ncbi:hypothetical protein VV02_15110 [Luteipulveratus mongoliensis]|uniref:N-acetyltransferase domain-containing protein n=1 Tax=Luteipulveratus mongoliensis TaxID=571913 RepID=A0A0K1JQG1_9MICO|nr:hypothetical protein VV02_15110 [Luteipulveratus mongoliensis]